MYRLKLALAGGLLATMIGCSGGGSAPVSGVVTVDGKPYSDAVVTFQPMGDPKNPNPGRGSSAETDENGRYVLKIDGDEEGAVVGKHRVRIMTKGNNVQSLDPDTGSSDEVPKNTKIEVIPDEWHSKSEKTFDVPSGGTDEANFDIISKKAMKKNR